MKLTLAILLLALTASAQDFLKIPDPPKPSHQWAYSSAFLVAAQATDAISSRGPGYETNPVLGRGVFGARQESIKGALTGGLLLTEYLVIRNHPRAAKAFAWANYVNAGVTFSVAAHNWKIR